MSLTQEEIKEQFIKAFGHAIRYLSFRARSEKEMTDFLTKKDLDPLIIAEVMTRLKKENLINDQDFANLWTEQRQSVKGKSKYAIKRELMQKGIDAVTIEKTLEESTGDFGVAKALWEKKKKRFAMYRGDEHFKKAVGFLQRKGYSYEIIKKVLKEEDTLE